MKTTSAPRDYPSEAKHRRIYRILVDEIAAGKFIPLGPFPSERALMRRFKVARETIRLTLRDLQEKGLVFSLQGRGTFLAAHKGNGTPLVRRPQPRGPRRKVGILFSGGHYTEIFGRICKTLRLLAAESGIDLIVGDGSDHGSESAGEALGGIVRRMVDEGVAGIILQPLEYGTSCHAQNDRLLSLIQKAKIPMVLIDSDVDTTRQNRGYDIVGIDNMAAGAVVAAHLRERGARRIRFLIDDCQAESILMRLTGSQIHCQEMNGAIRVDIDPTDVRAIRGLLFADPEIDAFICQNDVAAAKLIASLNQLGLRVPDDLLVAGFDDVSLAACIKPPLTTVHQPCERIARQALHLLLKRIEDPNRISCRLQLHAPLVVRASTGM